MFTLGEGCTTSYKGYPHNLVMGQCHESYLPSVNVPFVLLACLGLSCPALNTVICHGVLEELSVQGHI